MARPRNPIPTYREKNGRGIVTVRDALGNRRDILLPGSYGSAESKAAYERQLALLRACGGAMPQTKPANCERTIADLIVKFMQERVYFYYLDTITKEPTGEQENFKCAMRPLNRLYGDLPVTEFTPLCLVAVQNAMIDGSWMNEEERKSYVKAKRPLGLARGTVNTRIGRIKMMFRWAAKLQLVPSNVFHGLLSVDGLKHGRSKARDTKKTVSVAISLVNDTLPWLPPVVCDIVELLLLTGMRAGEAVIMRACDINLTGQVWLYRPARHKTAWRGHERVIAIGPRGQEIVRRYLKPKTDAYLFSPAEQAAMIREQKRAARKTKVQPSQLSRRKLHPKKKPGDQFTTDDINKAIKRACKRGKIPVWHVHQLRHTARKEVSRQHGLEAARAVLGHRSVEMTAEYGGHDQEAAMAVMAKIG